VDKEILKRIEESKKDYDKNAQRAELLKRNKTFLNELEGIKKRLGNKFFELKKVDIKKLTKISNDNLLLKLDYPKENIFKSEVPLEEVNSAYLHYLYYGEYNGYNPKVAIEKDYYFDSPDLNTVLVYDEDLDSIRTKIICKSGIIEKYMEKWIEFCTKWHTDVDWDGKLSSLSKFQNPLVSIGTDYRNLDLPIHINIGPWTSWKDIKDRWDDIEILKEMVSTKPQKSQNFSRDLCWYDLNKKLKLSPGKIAKLWIEHCPKDIDLLVIKKIKRAERELSEEKASELLEEIRGDPTMNDLKIQFENEREIYIKGPYSPFTDLIKKAIKSMSSKIKEFNLPAKQEFLVIPQQRNK